MTRRVFSPYQGISKLGLSGEHLKYLQEVDSGPGHKKLQFVTLAPGLRGHSNVTS